MHVTNEFISRMESSSLPCPLRSKSRSDVVPRIAPGDAHTKRIDDALSQWRQGDVALEGGWFVHVADGKAALTDEAAHAAERTNVIQVTTDGSVILTQTCDLVRPCLKRPFVEVAPLVEVEESIAHEIERGYRPNYAIIPALRARRLVADLDRVMTVEKSIVAAWTRIAGCATDEEMRNFAQTLARKRVRFAFPDDFNDLVKKLETRIGGKHDKFGTEGRALRGLREIRVTGSPSWDALAGVELFFWFVRNDAAPNFEGNSWDVFLEAWKMLVPPKGRFTRVEGVVITLGDMTASEYVNSDPLDLDYLSVRTA